MGKFEKFIQYLVDRDNETDRNGNEQTKQMESNMMEMGKWLETFNGLTGERRENSDKWFFIALDSDQDTNSAERDELMLSNGFVRKSPNKELPLPRSTYFGKINASKSAQAVIDKIWSELKKKNLSPTRIFGGYVDGWKVRTIKDEI